MAANYNFVIGIISYLPDDPALKQVRVKRLNALFHQCDELLNLPIMIIAQNWGGIQLREGTIRQSITIYNYKERLGITRARNELRKKFLESDYDYLIMLDDDSQLCGKSEDAKEYLDTIKAHPGMYGEYKPLLLKLFAISKEMYSLIELPEGGADDPDKHKRFFEDMMIIKTLDKLYPEKKIKFKHKSFMEVSDAAFDRFSVWHGNLYSDGSGWTRHDCGDNTRAIVKWVTKDSEGKVKWIWPLVVKKGTNWSNYMD